MAKIEEKVEELIKHKIENIGYDLYDVEYAKEGPNNYLRIFIDNEKGIDLNDCEKVSNEINDILDESDLIKDQYYLEVSSPGIERILRKEKHLQQSKGKIVEIRLFKKDKRGNKSYIGELKEFNAETIKIKLEEEIEIERKDIALIKIVYDWGNLKNESDR
jgi:ribosome maturation factor RimP